MTALLPAFVGVPERNRIYHTDAITLLKAMPDKSVDLILTDPPYGLGNGNAFEFPHKLYSVVRENWDREISTAWFAEVERVLKRGGSIVLFAGKLATYEFAATGLARGWRLVNDVTWVKGNAPPCFTGRNMGGSTERALWFCPDGTGWTYNLDWAKEQNGGTNFWDVWTGLDQINGTYTRLHPTQKPEALIARFVGLLSRPGDLVLDPFMGSGTMALAARNLGREFIGCDITAEYVAIARERLRNSDPFQDSVLAGGVVQHSLFAEVAG